MTPKEKAKELVEKYYHLPADIDKYGAKQCALIAVDEIIMCDAIFHANNKETIDERNYWFQVRKEIEEL